MNKLGQTLNEFLATQSAEVNVVEFLGNLGLAAILGYFLSLVYIRYGTSLSNRRMFARNFLLLTVITTLVITIVKSSLALSLGLVGALSIVRFRAAIKEPEELTYLFLSIGIGLGLGANQRGITLAAMLVIVLIIVVRGMFFIPKDENQNLFLTVSSHNPGKVELKDIVGVLRDHCRGVNLKRFDDTQSTLEASFLVEFEDFNNLEASRSALQNLGESVSVTFVDNKGLG
jgi:uncharacterized membrane protein YhiD involved in acid resistance